MAFKTSLAVKRAEISAAKRRYEIGLDKLAFATDSVNAMQVCLSHSLVLCGSIFFIFFPPKFSTHTREAGGLTPAIHRLAGGDGASCSDTNRTLPCSVSQAAVNGLTVTWLSLTIYLPPTDEGHATKDTRTVRSDQRMLQSVGSCSRKGVLMCLR